MSKGYMGKILNVDLSTGEISDETLPDEFYEAYLSGVGLAARLLYDRIPAGCDPLGPDNILALTAGVLTGTGAFMTGRFMANAKSPLTGGWGDSNCGGTFAPAIKKSGYDAVLFKGVSKKPVYLLVTNQGAELKDASHLWGKDIVDAEAEIIEEVGLASTRVAVIGQAGENLSLISGICNDKGRIAARSGLGAVMGSKKLKAVAMAGTRPVKVANQRTIKALGRKFVGFVHKSQRPRNILSGRLLNVAARALRVSPVTLGMPGTFIPLAMGHYGTIVTNVLSSENGDSPVKNWKGTGMVDFPISTHADKLNPDTICAYEQYKYHCYACNIGCGGILKVPDGKYPMEETHKVEYETACGFGTLCLNNDLSSIMKINDMCNRAGIDTISTAAVVSFALECFENGVLSSGDVDGLQLEWGNADTIVKLVGMIIDRKGIGDILADGVKRAAEKLGKSTDVYAMHAGGQELPMHDSRFDPGFVTSYELEPTPGRHTNVSYQWAELFFMNKIFRDVPKPKMLYMFKERLNPNGKAPLVAGGSNYMQLVNGAGGCLFAAQMGGNWPIIKYLNAATGWNLTPRQYLKIGERIQNLRQAFNAKHGRKPIQDFRMPDRAHGVPALKEGPLKGVTVQRDRINTDFCKEMGWDPKTAWPTRSKLKELGLGDVAKELYT